MPIPLSELSRVAGQVLCYVPGGLGNGTGRMSGVGLFNREKAGTVLVYVCLTSSIISVNKYIIISFRYNKII